MTVLRKSLMVLALSSSLLAGTYGLDVSHSSVGFKVKHLMISNVKGNFKSFSGEFEYDEKSKKLLSLNGVVDASSIDTDIEKRDDHLRSADFLDVKAYPDITFVLNKISGEKAYGQLTMHGVTKDIVLEYEVGGSIVDPWGNSRFGFALEGKINRKDFGLKWNKILETGGLTVGEVVKFDIEIEGILKK